MNGDMIGAVQCFGSGLVLSQCKKATAHMATVISSFFSQLTFKSFSHSWIMRVECYCGGQCEPHLFLQESYIIYCHGGHIAPLPDHMSGQGYHHSNTFYKQLTLSLPLIPL